ncbi:MAG TPA: hypothetical protein VGQ59_03005 [Cyclobacteriaceae bacterium]|nr:hypothetical protein [Cyclobacteriaceae bacterium]
MSRWFFLATFLLIGFRTNAQTFNCGVTSALGFTGKVQTQIVASDSLVKFIANGKQTTFKRIPSTSTIYFTDGVITQSIAYAPQVGKIKGFAYTHSLVYNSNVNSGKSTEAILFCVIKD